MSTNDIMQDAIIYNRYHLVEILGQGGMGVVYRAEDQLTGETVALKRVTQFSKDKAWADDVSKEELLLALAHEFQILAGLRHPNIISVLDYGFDTPSEAGQQSEINQPNSPIHREPFFTMTYLADGQTLLDAAEGKSLEQKLALIGQLLQALTYLHRRGVVHRDLKPGNVLVAQETVRVLDFGLAITPDDRDSLSVGTPLYMAPELLERAMYTPWSDRFALGVLITEVLAGTHPFAPLDYAFFDRVLDEEPDLRQMDVRLRPFVQRLLSKFPEERFDSGNDMLMAWQEAVNHQAVNHQAVNHQAVNHQASTVIVETEAIRESYLQAAIFVGRDTEMAQLQQALTQAASGHGSLWLLGGESGVGKSRLLSELRTFALVDGVRVLRGQAIAEGGSPFQLWRNVISHLALHTSLSDLETGILKEVVPELERILNRSLPDAPSLQGNARQQRLIFTMIQLLQRQTHPTLLLLEDLHWTQEGLDILKQLTPQIETLPLLIIGSFRSDERPHLPDEFAAGVHQITLARFGDTHIGQLAKAMLGDVAQQPAIVDQLQTETEGNVFFLVEILRAWAEEMGGLLTLGEMVQDVGQDIRLPEHVFTGGIEQIIRRRLAKVPASSQALLKLAAIAGRALDLDVLSYLQQHTLTAQNLPDLQTWLLACSEAMVLDVQENQWQFAHDKLREFILQTLTPDEKRHGHQQVALALELHYPNQPSLAYVLAEHWHNAGDVSKEVAYTIVAGEQLNWSGAHAESVRMTQRLLDDPEITLPDTDRLGLLEQLGKGYIGLHLYTEAIDCTKAGLSLARQQAERQGNQQTVIGYLNDLANATVLQLQYEHNQADKAAFDDADSYLEESRFLAEQLGEHKLLADAIAIQSVIALLRDQDFTRANALGERALTLYQPLNDQEGIVTVLQALSANFYLMGDRTRTKQYSLEALTLARQIGNPNLTPFILNLLIDASIAEKEWTLAEAYQVEFMQYAPSPHLLFYGKAYYYASIIAFHHQDYAAMIYHTQKGLKATQPRFHWLHHCLQCVATLMLDDTVLFESAFAHVAAVDIETLAPLDQLYCWLLTAAQALLVGDVVEGASLLDYAQQHFSIPERTPEGKAVHIQEVMRQVQQKFQTGLETALETDISKDALV
ncbi:MAG: AAA family ATPase [Chloroflexota bacterium]